MNTKGKKRAGFMRPTLTIPTELSQFIDQQKNDPRHAGNLSSYIRMLIIEDKARQEAQASVKTAA